MKENEEKWTWPVSKKDGERRRQAVGKGESVDKRMKRGKRAEGGMM